MISSSVPCKGFIGTCFHFKRCQENTFTSNFTITLMSLLKVDAAGGWLYFNYWFFVKDHRASGWFTISPDLLLSHKIILSLLSIFCSHFKVIESGDWPVFEKTWYCWGCWDVILSWQWFSLKFLWTDIYHYTFSYLQSLILCNWDNLNTTHFHTPTHTPLAFMTWLWSAEYSKRCQCFGFTSFFELYLMTQILGYDGKCLYWDLITVSLMVPR